MIKPLIGLALAGAVAVSSVAAAPLSAPSRLKPDWSLPSLSPASWTAAAAAAAARAQSEAVQKEETLWTWVEGLMRGAHLRVEVPAQPVEGAEAPESRGAAADGKSPDKPSRRKAKPADRDEAREKTGPEPLPMAF